MLFGFPTLPATGGKKQANKQTDMHFNRVSHLIAHLSNAISLVPPLLSDQAQAKSLHQTEEIPNFRNQAS